MSEFVSQAKYAEIRGVSKKTVTMWKNKGWIVLDANELVDVKASDVLVKKYRIDGLNPTPTLPDGQKRVNQYDTAARIKHTPKKDDDFFEDEDGDLESGGATLQEAKRVKENYLALQEKLEYEIQQGKHIEIEEAKRLFFEEARKVRDAWINWPIQVTPHIAAELDVPADKLLTVLNDYVYQHLKDLGKPTFNDEDEDD